MEQVLDVRGGRLDLLVTAGSDVPVIGLTIRDRAGALVDFTGSVLEAFGLTRGVAPQRVAMVTAVTGPGTVELSVAADEVARMDAPGTLSARPAVGADWWLVSTGGTGRRTQVLYGQVLVSAGGVA